MKAVPETFLMESGIPTYTWSQQLSGGLAPSIEVDRQSDSIYENELITSRG